MRNFKHKYILQQPTANITIDCLGGNVELGKRLGITSMAISAWRKNGIPKLREFQIRMIIAEDMKRDGLL